MSAFCEVLGCGCPCVLTYSSLEYVLQCEGCKKCIEINSDGFQCINSVPHDYCNTCHSKLIDKQNNENHENNGKCN